MQEVYEFKSYNREITFIFCALQFPTYTGNVSNITGWTVVIFR